MEFGRVLVRSTDTGVIAFTDVDLTDVHLVSPTGTAIGTTLGTLTAVKNTDTTGTGTGGQLTWTYTVAAAAVEDRKSTRLNSSHQIISHADLCFKIKTRQIDVTITGTNDALVSTVQHLIGAVTELVPPAVNLTDTAVIAFTDVDFFF